MPSRSRPVPGPRLTGWLVTERHAGMKNQCIGLAEALELDWVLKEVEAGLPWTLLPPTLWWRPLRRAVSGADLAPPWPDVVISCGRRSVAAAAALRRAAAGRTFAVHIQSPYGPPERFDVVTLPRHDGLSGDNVVVTRGSLHRITPARLEAAAGRFAPAFAHLPRPLVAVLVGGSNRRQRFTPEVAGDLADMLVRAAGAAGAGLAVTPSRRTGEASVGVLHERLAGPAASVWDGEGENPYFGLLALADAVVVTADSVNMTSEACATGKPVHVYHFGDASRRHAAFHHGLRADGVTRRFAGRFTHWTYEPLDETEAVAAAVRDRMP